ncbi:MAG: DUF1553 domain-containing protein, partial [Planctomycetota bacterium]
DFLGNVSMGDPIWMGGDGQFRDGTQQDFHRLAAFFTGAKADGLRGIQNDAPEYVFQFLDSEETELVSPQVPFRRDLVENDDPSVGMMGSGARRVLADWLTHPENKQFARAAVVRVWTLLFGRPPAALDAEVAVDDLPLDITDHPMIVTLTDAFIESGFDFRMLIKWITSSPAFIVDSQADFEVTRRHEDAMVVFPIVQLRGDQVAGAISQAGRIKTIDRDSSWLTQLQQFGDQNDFLKRYGDLGEDEFNTQAITLTQRLTMLNGKMVNAYSDWNPVLNATAHVGMFARDDAAAIESLYLTVLNRVPTQREAEHFLNRIDQAGSRKNAFEDLVWILFNSSEFAWNH